LSNADFFPDKFLNERKSFESGASKELSLSLVDWLFDALINYECAHTPLPKLGIIKNLCVIKINIEWTEMAFDGHLHIVVRHKSIRD
jgi:hypothetical protein